MNSKTYIDIQFRGLGFSPKKLAALTGLPIEPLVESGEIAKIGRYRDKPSPYGLALLKVPPKANAILNYSNLLLKQKDLLEECNVQEILFDVETSYEGFKEISITPKLACNLSILNARIEFNKIENENDFDNLSEKLLRIILSSPSFTKKEITEHLLVLLDKNKLLKQISSQIALEIIKHLSKNIDKSNQQKTETVDETLKVYSK